MNNKSVYLVLVLSCFLAFQAQAQVTAPTIITLSPTKTVSSQLMKSECVYRVQYDFDLQKSNIKIPDNCVLVFDGGSFKNGTIDLNKCQIEGKGIKCNIKNPGDYSYTLSLFLSQTEDPALNRSVIQVLLDAKVPVIIDIPELTFSGYLSVSSGCVVQALSNKRVVLRFPNSKGFVWDKKVYSQNNEFEGLHVLSKGNCFDFVNGGNKNRPYNVYFSTFRNIKAQSQEGDCFYSGEGNYGYSGDFCTFDNLFEDIEVVAPKGSGFVGLNGNTQHFLKIRCIECGVACFYNCSGVFDSCNGTFGNTPTFFVGTRRSKDKPARYTCVFRNCNVESYKSVLFSCKDPLCYMELSFEDCSFYIAPNKQKIIDFFPFDFVYLFSFRMRNTRFYRLNGGEYDDNHSLFYIGYLSNVICFDIDQDISITDNKNNKTIAKGKMLSINRDNSSAIKPSVGDCYFDTSVGKPLWWDGKRWVDANGVTNN